LRRLAITASGVSGVTNVPCERVGGSGVRVANGLSHENCIASSKAAIPRTAGVFIGTIDDSDCEAI